MQVPVIETQHLHYSFTSGEPVLTDLNLCIPNQSIYGFLGPNGAGKTTTLRLLLGLLKNQKGHIAFFGRTFQTHRLEILRRVGSLIEQPSLYLHLSGRENLEIFRLTYRCEKKRIDEVLQMVRLQHAASKRVKAYSLGMKQRLSIAMALLHDPEVLILDEPTNGLDPNGIVETRELIRYLNAEAGKTILVSSHLLSEVEKMATHVGIIHKGRLLFQGSLQQLQQVKSRSSEIEIEVSDASVAYGVLAGHGRVKQVNGTKVVVNYENREQTALINKMLVQQGIDVYQLAVTQNGLENLFIQMTSE